MTMSGRNIGLFALMALLLMSVGFIQSWDVSLTLLNLCIISAIMALGVNIQWGYAGLFNVGTMGFAALGALDPRDAEIAEQVVAVGARALALEDLHVDLRLPVVHRRVRLGLVARHRGVALDQRRLNRVIPQVGIRIRIDSL
mgnify:CR=1 FL=1